MKLPGDPWNNLWSGFNEIASVSMEFHGKCPNPLWKLSMEKFPWKLVSLSSMQFHGNLFDGDIFHEIDVLILHGIPWRFSTRVVTIVRAQHKRSLFLMVIIHRFFLFSRSRHRRPGLRLLSRPEPGPRIDTNTTPTWKPRVGLNDSLLLNLPANWANSSSKRAVRCKNPPTVKLADWYACVNPWAVMAKLTKWWAGRCWCSNSVSMAWCMASVKASPTPSPATGSRNWRNWALNWIGKRPRHFQQGQPGFLFGGVSSCSWADDAWRVDVVVSSSRPKHPVDRHTLPP